LKSLFYAASLAIGLGVLPVEAGDRAADYSGEIEDRNPFSVLAHNGVVRIDTPVRKGVASDYGEPGQLPRMSVYRDGAGEITMLLVTGPYRTRPAPINNWRRTGAQRTLAQESCDVQQREGTTDVANRRCVTADGVVLAFFHEYREKVLKSVKRKRVAAAEVRPPVELFELKRWGLTKALLARPASPKTRDYEAVFELEGGVVTIRRSGEWTSRIRTGPAPSTLLLNEEVQVMIATAEYGAPEIRYRRATKESPLFVYPSRPTAVDGVDSQTVAGETCRWHYRSISVDASELECRAADGAVLGIGYSGVGGTKFSLPQSFVRKPLALASIMPDPTNFDPETYGFRRQR